MLTSRDDDKIAGLLGDFTEALGVMFENQKDYAAALDVAITLLEDDLEAAYDTLPPEDR